MTEAKRKALSARELDVARLLATGVSNKEIARALGIEVVTVKRHVGNILRKLGVENRTQAAMALAERTGKTKRSDGTPRRTNLPSAIHNEVLTG